MAGSSWDFTLANYGAVWAFMVQIGLLLLFMMVGNILRRTIPLFRKCLIPSALLGGAQLLVANIITKHFFNFNFSIQELHTSLQKIYAHLALRITQEHIKFILMNDSF